MLTVLIYFVNLIRTVIESIYMVCENNCFSFFIKKLNDISDGSAVVFIRTSNGTPMTAWMILSICFMPDEYFRTGS